LHDQENHAYGENKEAEKGSCQAQHWVLMIKKVLYWPPNRLLGVVVYQVVEQLGQNAKAG
jgi:hypothetical protein